MSVISNQLVLHTPAGYYVGRLYRDDELGGDFPYSRDSEYMSEADAKKLLECWNREEDEAEDRFVDSQEFR